MRPQKISANMKTEERILANALKHFCDFGYNGTSVREITTASEVTKPTLYYYFKNKEELFAKLASTCFEMILKNIEESINKETSFQPCLKALFNSMNDVYSTNPGALRFIHSIVVAPQMGIPDVGVTKFLERLDGYVDSIIQKGIDSGEVLAQKRTFARVVISSLLGQHTKSIITGAHYNPQDRELMDKVICDVVFCVANTNCHS